MKLAERLEALIKQRENMASRAGQLQQALNETLVQINQIDGAIQIVKDLISEGETEDEQQ